MIYIGYLSKRIFNYVLDYGNIRTMKRMREFYCDLMFPISSVRDDTKLPEAPNYGNAWLVHHSWGGRIGWMSHSARIVGLYFKLEGGWLPGWQQASNSGSFYTTVMFGFCFSSGIAKSIQL